MTSFPAGIARVPNLLISDLTLRNATRTNIDLVRAQERLATGRAINRPSDDAVRASAISLLNERLERAGQVERNLNHAQTALDEADQALGEATDLLIEAKQIALAQVGSTSTGDERRAQAEVIDSLIRGALEMANRQSVAGFIFGGQAPGVRPVEELGSGFRTRASEAGLITDLGVGVPIPITLGGTTPLGSSSQRVVGQVDLDPALTLDTRVADLDGARGVGVSLGEVEFEYTGQEPRSVDLSGAETVGDVVDRLESAILSLEGELGEPILGPEGVTISGGSIMVDVLPGTSGTGDPVSLVFGDVGNGTAAADLGLVDDGSEMEFIASSAMGLGLSPRLTPMTPISALRALEDGDPPTPLGRIRIRALGRSEIVDLSGAERVQDLRRLIEGTGLGLRVEVEEPGSRLVVVTDVAAGRAGAMSIEEVDGEELTASRLGIRTLDAQTRLSSFNDGRGVSVLGEASDPVTGQVDPSKSVDFVIRAGNGFEVSIDLRGEDVTTVGALVEAINQQAESQLTAAGLDPDLVRAGLTTGPNGIALFQDVTDPSVAGAITVESRNGSTAAGELGLLDGVYDAGSGVLVGEDRARVRAENLFTGLLDLRDSLRANDVSGISLAGGVIDEQLDLLAETRALVGQRSQRVEGEALNVEDRMVIDEATRSRLRDTDFARAASELTRLQTQLQAGFQAASITGNLSLLDFLG